MSFQIPLSSNIPISAPPGFLGTAFPVNFPTATPSGPTPATPTPGASGPGLLIQLPTGGWLFIGLPYVPGVGGPGIVIAAPPAPPSGGWAR